VHPKAKITSKGQVTIPLAIREALGLITGSQLSFELSGSELLVRHIDQKSWTDLWTIAAAAPKPATPVNISAAIQAAVRERFDR
jgi:AbrB family looped-hinge helix DNA binding protein